MRFAIRTVCPPIVLRVYLIKGSNSANQCTYTVLIVNHVVAFFSRNYIIITFYNFFKANGPVLLKVEVNIFFKTFIL